MAVAEGTYVKINEDHHSTENITPGELNQAIDIERLTARICEQCGQPLPVTYTPPTDEDWTTGIFGCAEDPDSCKHVILFGCPILSPTEGFKGLFCPCVVFGGNVAAFNQDISEQQACVSHGVCIEGGITLAAMTAAFNGVVDPDTICLVTEGLLFAWWVCAIYTGMGRQLLQRKYHLKDSPCDPCMVHCCFHWCAICQEHREMRNHLAEGTSSKDTEINPPPVQQMNSIKKEESTASPSRRSSGENNLQLQPV